jgi:hypothetical protein
LAPVDERAPSSTTVECAESACGEAMLVERERLAPRRTGLTPDSRAQIVDILQPSPFSAIIVAPAASPTSTVTTSGAPQRRGSPFAGGGSKGSPATDTDEMSRGVQSDEARLAHARMTKRQLLSAAPSVSQAGSPSVQRTSLSPSVAETPSKPIVQSVSARPPPSDGAPASA